jgi:hypothetical protein
MNIETLEQRIIKYLYRNMPDREQLDGETGDQLCEEKEGIAKDVAFDVTQIFNNHIISLIDEMIKEMIEIDETVTTLQEAAHDAKIRVLTQLKEKIEKL